MTVQPEQDPTPEVPEETTETPKGTMQHIQDVKPRIAEEIKEFAIAMKDGALEHLDEHAQEVLTLGVTRGRDALRNSLSGFIAGATGVKSASPCEVIKKDGEVCGYQKSPCRYHGGN